MSEQPIADHFKDILLTVVGQAFTAAGYTLEDKPVKQAGGLFRFVKPLENGLYAYIEFQLLRFADNEWAAGVPSRFRVTLIRSDQPDASLPTQHPDSAQRLLSALVVEDFRVPILPSAAHWWSFRAVDDLGQALAEAGSLAVGYGMPWLSGELVPPT